MALTGGVAGGLAEAGGNAPGEEGGGGEAERVGGPRGGEVAAQ